MVGKHMNLLLSTLRTVIKAYPAVVPHLTGRARWVAFAIARPAETFENNFYTDVRHWKSRVAGELMLAGVSEKTYDYFLQTVERLVQSVYRGDLGGEFIDVMASLIQGQLTQAYTQAWSDEGEGGDLPSYLSTSLEDMILNQYDFVDQYFRDIVTARLDETPIDPLLARAALWANRYNEAYNEALLLIRAEMGENLEWVYGDDIQEHCPECEALNGIVARASEWQSLNVHPQGAPNDKISCGGWRCGCTLLPTDKRRSPKAFDTIMNITSK